MTRINLYPWRIEIEERQKKQFVVILVGVAILTAIIMMLINQNYKNAIAQQEDINRYINKELVIINKELRDIAQLKSQKEALINRLSVIQQIEHDRYNTIALFNEITKLINPLIVLKQINRQDNTVKVYGYAESNTQVAKFLRSLEISQYFKNAELNQIKVDSVANEKYGLPHTFELQFFQSTKIKES